MYSSYSNSVQALYHLRKTKLYCCYYKSPIAKENPRQLICSVHRIICTSSSHQNPSRAQFNHKLTSSHEVLCCYSPFLKENFNIVDNRYFKLLSDSNVICLKELLKKEEMKDLISSSFSFNVDLTCMSKYNGLPVPIDPMPAFEDLCKSTGIKFVEKQSLEDVQGVLWCSKSSSSNDTGKPTEQQLLYIISKLTHSMLHFFEKSQDYSIYHKNIVFQNNIQGITIRGLISYIQTMYILRIYGIIQYGKVRVEILKITHHIEDGTVRVRWRVNGISRQQLLKHIWKSKELSFPEETEWFDGFSVFSVGTDGLIYKHICDKLTPSHEPVNPKKTLRSRIFGLIDMGQRRPAGSLSALMYSPKKIT